MTRRFARELALQTLFSVEVGKQDPSEALEQNLARGDSDDRAFVKELVLGTLEHAEQTDSFIAPLLEGWTLERLPTVDRCCCAWASSNCATTPKPPRPS